LATLWPSGLLARSAADGITIWDPRTLPRLKHIDLRGRNMQKIAGSAAMRSPPKARVPTRPKSTRGKSTIWTGGFVRKLTAPERIVDTPFGGKLLFRSVASTEIAIGWSKDRLRRVPAAGDDLGPYELSANGAVVGSIVRTASDNVLHLWKFRGTGSPIHPTVALGGSAGRLQISEAGDRATVNVFRDSNRGRPDRLVRIDTRTGAQEVVFDRRAMGKDPRKGVLSPDHDWLAITNETGALEMWRAGATAPQWAETWNIGAPETFEGASSQGTACGA
jgi:hypothetical protein